LSEQVLTKYYVNPISHKLEIVKVLTTFFQCSLKKIKLTAAAAVVAAGKLKIKNDHYIDLILHDLFF
jgi:hypothetical protein